jgi:predicted small lipoprotein YifL
MVTKKHKRSRCIVPAALVLMALAVSVTACGKKAPPIVPVDPTLSPVSDLAGDVYADQVRLRWSISGRQSDRLSGAGVYRLKILIDKDRCPSCPTSGFEKIADLPAKLFATQSTRFHMAYSDTLEFGYEHVYKVVLFGADGQKSADSNLFAVRLP